MIAVSLALVLAAAPLGAAPLAIMEVRVETGSGTTLEKATVLVDGGRITAMGADVRVPPGAERVDGKGKVLTPGLWSTNAQVGLVEVGLEESTTDARLRDSVVPAFRAVDGFNPLSARVAIDREQGVTSEVLTPQGGLLHGQGFVVELSGTLASVGTAQRAAMFGSFGGGARDAGGGARGGVALRLREIFDDVRFFKANRAAFDRAEARSLSLPRVHLEALIDVVEGRLPLVLAVDRAADILALLAFAREQNVRVVVNGGAEAWVVAAELAAARVPVILQPSAMEPSSFEALQSRDDAAALLQRAGVPLILTAGATDLGTTRVRQEAGIAVAYGLSREEALRAVTETPARVFGADKDLGVVAVGKRANLVLWSGDPLETTTEAVLVLVGGERMSLGTRQRDLAERYRVRRLTR